MARVAELIGDKWTLLILREAFYGVQRYDDMRQDLSVPRSMLTDRLGKLVKNGLMERRPYQEPGDRVRQSYVLTAAGRALGTTLIAMAEWGEKHILEHPSPVQIVSLKSSKSVMTRLLDSDGEEVTPNRVVLKAVDK